MASASASTSAVAANDDDNNTTICSVCGDWASREKYGVLSCTPCQGFFFYTVLKDLSYACRFEKKCVVDTLARCQYCRFQKCLTMGMTPGAVHQANARIIKQLQEPVKRTISDQDDMDVERIRKAEAENVWQHSRPGQNVQSHDAVWNILHSAGKQLYSLVAWASRIPHFSSLQLEDQAVLIRSGWIKLLVTALSHRSTSVENTIVLANGVQISRADADRSGVGELFNYVLIELVAKMKEFKVDLTEIGCLRAVVLFNPQATNLKNVAKVKLLRDKVHASLKKYYKSNHSEKLGRYLKLFDLLESLPDISRQIMKKLSFYKTEGTIPMDSLLAEMLE